MSTRFLTALAVAALLGACADDQPATAPSAPSLANGAGHNTADHYTIDQPADFQLTSPCTGELIDFTGRETGQITAVDTRENLDNGNSVHYEHIGRVVATGIGETTGATYQIDDLFHEDFESPSPPAPQVTITFQETIRVTGTAPGTGFTVREEFHLVLQPSSPDAKVTREVESVRCEG
jgi:hypothetical protein